MITYRARPPCAVGFSLQKNAGSAGEYQSLGGSQNVEYDLPMLMVVASNTIYNICAKSTPEQVNPFASLVITYTVAAVCAAGMFFVTAKQKNIFLEFSGTNWTAWVLGVVIVGLEFGFLCLYRAGWKISTGNLVASISLACVLLAVGLLLYHETLSLRQIIGMAVCAAGLILIAK